MHSISHIQAVEATIDEILFSEWDPIGVSGIPGSKNEYSGYVAQLFRLISRGTTTRSDIEACLLTLEREFIGLTGDPERAKRVADLLFALKEE